MCVYYMNVCRCLSAPVCAAARLSLELDLVIYLITLTCNCKRSKEVRKRVG